MSTYLNVTLVSSLYESERLIIYDQTLTIQTVIDVYLVRLRVTYRYEHVRISSKLFVALYDMVISRVKRLNWNEKPLYRHVPQENHHLH